MEMWKISSGYLEVLESLTGDLQGKYYALKDMMEAEQQQMIYDHFLFEKPVSPLLLASGMARDWPDGRGIWWESLFCNSCRTFGKSLMYMIFFDIQRYNEYKTFLVWVNEKDHLRVISMQKGGNMKEVFTRFCDGLAEVYI